MTDWELIIVDDESSDKTNEIIKNFSKQDTRIRAFFLEKNSGASFARNIGIDNAKNKYIAFLDSDDLWAPDKLSVQISLMEKENIDFSFTSYYVMNSSGTVVGTRRAKEYLTYKKLLWFGNDIGCLTVVYNRERFKEYRFNNNIRGHEDYKMWLDIFKDLEKVYSLDKPLSLYRVHPGSKNLNKWRSLVWNWHIWHRYEHLNFFETLFIAVRWMVYKVLQRFLVPFN
jgi:teichuronic acid biosynthesis glycosyltransferase TuaG